MEPSESLPALKALSELLQDSAEGIPSEMCWLSLEQFEGEVQEMCQGLHAQCLDFLYDEELQKLVDPILESYQLTYAAIDALKDAWAEGEPWHEHWEQAQSRLKAALGGYPTLADWYERQPKLSPSPYIHELLRVGRACLAELLPWEAFSLRLEHYIGVLEQFCQRYQEEEIGAGSWGLSPRQREQLEQCVESLWPVIEQLEQLDPEFMEPALEQLGNKTEQLFQWQQQVQLDFEQPLRGELSCPRCANPNPRTQRICSACGARLPQSLDETSQTSTVDLHSEGGNRGLPQRLAELVDAIEQLESGQLGLAECLQHVVQARSNAERVGKQLSQLKPAEEALVQQGQQLLRDTHQQYLGVLDRLMEALESDDRASLPGLSEELKSCAEGPRRLQELSMQAREVPLESGGAPVA